MANPLKTDSSGSATLIRIRFPPESSPFDFHEDALLYKPFFGIALATALFSSNAFAEIAFRTASPDLSHGVNLADSKVADDFELQHASFITGIRFWTIEDASPGFSAIDWTIAASGGSPGQTIAESTSTIRSRQATGRQTSPNENLSLGQLDEYEQVLTFDQPVRLGAGDYWLLLDATRSAPIGATPQWIWETAPRTVGTYPIYRNPPVPFGWAIDGSLFQHDMAFELVGTAVPEPGNLPWIAVAIVWIIGKRKRGEVFSDRMRPECSASDA